MSFPTAQRTSSDHTAASNGHGRAGVFGGHMTDARGEQLMHLLPSAVCLCDAEGRVSFFNRRLEELLGSTPQVGRPWQEFTAKFAIYRPDGARAPNDATPLMNAVREGVSFRELELEIVRPDGTRFTANADIDPLVGPNGRPNGAIMAFQDITARKRTDRHAAMLARLTQEVALLSDERKICEVATRVVGEHLECERCCFAEAEPNGAHALVRQGWRRSESLPALEGSFPLEAFGPQELRAKAASTAFAVNDVALDSETQAFAAGYAAVGVRAFVTAPFLREQGWSVVLLATESRPRVWRQDELVLLEAAAARVWPIVERARAMKKIREHGQSLEAAEESSRQLAALVQSSHDAIIGVTLQGVITSWNPGAERMFGYTVAETVGRPVTLLIPPDRHNEEPAILAKISRGEHTDHYETVRCRKDGTLLHISLSVSPVKSREGRIVGAVKIARDVTARRRAEERQRALTDMLARVNRAAALPEIYEAALAAILHCLDADRVAILLYDEEKTMRFAAWRGLSDDYRAAVEGHSPWRPDDPAPRPVCLEDVGAVELDPRVRAAVEREGIRALAFIPLSYEQLLLGKFMIYYNTPHAFDADELQLAEVVATQVAFAIERQKGAQALEALVNERTQSLRQAIAQMEEFSYSVSHDLRSPVRAMRGYAEALLDDYGERLDDNGRELLARIQRNGLRMDRLIQDLLTYSRISRREIQFEPVSLDKLVHEVIQQYPEMRPERAEIHVGGPLPEVLAHEPSLTQVVSNLLSNAVKFVPPQTKPRIRIGFDQSGERVRLWVKDNGIGIKPEYQRRLFGMFERMHPDKSYEGTGIGLAIVRKAIERMNGKVGMESDGASGSRFWVELPAAPKA